MMPPFSYLVGNKVVNKDPSNSKLTTDSGDYNPESNSLKVKNAYVDGERLIFDDIIGW